MRKYFGRANRAKLEESAGAVTPKMEWKPPRSCTHLLKHQRGHGFAGLETLFRAPFHFAW